MDLQEALGQLVTVLTSQDIQNELWPAKAVFIFFTFAFLAGIIYFILVSSFLKHRILLDFRDFFDLNPTPLRRIIRRWKTIEKRLTSGSEYEYKLAIMEVDDLFNSVLLDKGFAGMTFEDRVSQIKKIQLPNPEEVLQAHQERNTVAHDPNYRVTKEHAKKLLEVYEKAIKSIESF